MDRKTKQHHRGSEERKSGPTVEGGLFYLFEDDGRVTTQACSQAAFQAGVREAGRKKDVWSPIPLLI